MLVLVIKQTEKIRIGEALIQIRPIRHGDGWSFRIAIDAPRSVVVTREKVDATPEKVEGQDESCES